MKKILSILALFLVFGGSVAAYAYWDSLTASETQTVIIGEGTSIVVSETVSPGANDVLVPDGVVLKANDVTEITFEYNVQLDQTPLEQLLLNVDFSNVRIDGDLDVNNFVVINVQSPNLIDGNVATVIVTVSLNEPASLEEYNQIVNGTITFDLVFEATINE